MATASAPRIAVARSRKPHDYLASLRGVGAEPWLLDPATDRPLAVLDHSDGLVLTGGGDVDPRLYGEEAHAAYHPAEAGRDAYEIELVTRALERDVPLLAICRGIQVLNVAAGGTLVQHIPDAIAGAASHDVPEPADAPAHEVTLARGSLIASLLRPGGPRDPRPVTVNSRHHQAALRVGAGLVVTAVAPDGVVEALERPGARFCLGVQWHPENFWRAGEFATLFAALATAAAARPARPFSAR